MLVDSQNYDELHTKYGASRSFNEVSRRLLQHHEWMLNTNIMIKRGVGLSCQAQAKSNRSRQQPDLGSVINA